MIATTTTTAVVLLGIGVLLGFVLAFVFAALAVAGATDDDGGRR